MASNIVQFKADLVAFAKVKDLALAAVCKGTVVRLQNMIVEDTPVDTGRARSGWAFSIGEPSDFEPPPLTPEQKAARDAAHDKKQPSPVFFEKPAAPDISEIDGTQKLYLTNNVVYIQALEEGHSQQAPAGMVAVNVLTLETSMEQVVAAALAEAQATVPGA